MDQVCFWDASSMTCHQALPAGELTAKLAVVAAEATLERLCEAAASGVDWGDRPASFRWKCREGEGRSGARLWSEKAMLTVRSVPCVSSRAERFASRSSTLARSAGAR